MGVAIPQIITEDRASGALVVDGGLRFDSSKSHNLINNNTRSASSADYTVSVWVKRVSLNSSGLNAILQYETGDTFAFSLTFYADKVYAYDSSGFDADAAYSDGLLRDTSGWYHLHYKRTSGGTGTLYINGVQQSKQTSGTLNLDAFAYNGSIGYRQKDSTRYLDAYLSNLYVIDGQALNPSSFGFTDPLTNTWRPKKYTGTYGTKGFFLPFDGSAPIGQDQSGRGNNWTPVNFGGSNTLEKATGALPILNTDGGGKVARVGVRTDSSASSLVLALPLVGIKSDFSNAVNSGTSNKAITNTGSMTFPGGTGGFYDSAALCGSGKVLTTSSSADFNFGTGDFTIEYWLYRTSLGNNDSAITNYSQVGSGYLICLHAGTGFNDASLYLNGSVAVQGGTPQANVWNHYAYVRSGTTCTIYKNGIAIASGTSSAQAGSTNVMNIGAYSDGSSNISGYMQDVRMYKGLAKYTQNFIPASTDPDILPDTPSGVSYTSNLTQITDGAISSGSASSYLTLASSADFGFGTGDFTIEFFVYETAKVYTNNFNPRAFDFGNTLQMVLHIPSDGGTIRIDYADSTLMTSNGTLFVNKWNHIALVRSGSTLSLYINGVFDKSVSNSTNVPTPSSTIYIGRYYGSDSGWINGFISNFHVVKGTALYTSNFTPPTGPISSVANTKLLCCKSNSSATAFDVSPGTITANGNAAATNFNPFTVNINTQRGKQSGWCTLNPLDNNGGTLSDGNLTKTSSAGASNVSGTVSMLSGKWYWEVVISGSASGGVIGIGAGSAMAGTALSNLSKIYGWAPDGNKYANTTASSYAGSYTVGDVIGVSFDADTRQLTFYKNNISQGLAFTVDSGFTYMPQIHLNVMNVICNFGQKPFKFPPPAGFQPLALANTPRPSIVRPDQYVGIVTYYAADAVAGIATGLSFKPDLVWVKSRTSARSNVIVDSVRGTNSVLWTDLTDAQLSSSQYVSQFNSNGFNYGAAGDVTNNSSLVGWCWKAGGNSNTFNINDVGYATASAAGLTAGTITPTGASVNTKSGFSIVSFTSDSSTNIFSVAHGLQNTPKFVIVKSRDNGVAPWYVYHSSLATDNYLRLNGTNATASDGANQWGNGMTSSVIGLRAGYTTVASTATIAYCWAEIPGFSKFGSYTGTDTSNYIHLGFRPALVIIKNATKTSSAFSSWMIQDAERSPYNPTSGSNKLWANRATQEGYRGNGSETSNLTANNLDFDSNGFYIPSSASTELNETGQTFIYAAWAETPTQNLYGAQANAR